MKGFWEPGSLGLGGEQHSDVGLGGAGLKHRTHGLEERGASPHPSGLYAVCKHPCTLFRALWRCSSGGSLMDFYSSPKYSLPPDQSPPSSPTTTPPIFTWAHPEFRSKGDLLSHVGSLYLSPQEKLRRARLSLDSLAAR